ncbi:site-specific integrase [Bacteroides hominis]|uniref:site-specific integrase n=1 Tax=Bacteroides hominis TaxID=2763023 RepID=UPI002949BFDC|nr:site-specific integrase [Bacteroides hominis (ex Liu et al. 2022)]MDV6193708.1 site-specific integrase [Bacteroides hominis (ex Liu et al. 2022)]
MGTTIKAMLNTDRRSVSGLYPLVIRIIHKRRKKLIYSGFKLREEDFDSLSERVLWHPDSPFKKAHAKKMNLFILAEKNALERSIAQQGAENFTLETLTTRVTRSRGEQYVFVYAANEILLKHASGRFGTANLYQSTVNSLKRFCPKESLTFREITYRFLYRYICFLEKSGVCDNTIHMYLRNLRSIYNKARREGVALGSINPFNEVRMNVLPTVKRALPKESIYRLSTLDLSDNPRLEIARDLFLFSFYTRGMSFVDIVLLKKSNIIGTAIYYSRAKTRQPIRVGIIPALQSLLDKYDNDSVYVLPFIGSSQGEPSYTEYRKLLSLVNSSLKEVGRMLGISTPLTTYVARHSWATIAKQEGAPIAAISEGLGHTTEKTTRIYLRSFDAGVIDDINMRVVNLCINRNS